MIYGLSFRPTKSPKTHASTHQATCAITSTFRDKHENVSLLLKKAVRWSTKGNLPPGNENRASWHSWCVCYCTHSLGIALIQQHLAALYRTANYLPKHVAFTEREREQWLCVSSNRSMLMCKVIFREMIQTAWWRKNWLALKKKLNPKTLMVL